MKRQKLKTKLLNHILQGGKKQISEKILTKNFKSIQKSQKKSHSEIVKLAILNSIPMFRIIKLKNKRRKKNSVKEIPAFLSNYSYRTSWSIKYLVKTSTSKASNGIFHKLEHEIMSNVTREGNTVTFKNELQGRVLPKKKYFRHYRW